MNCTCPCLDCIEGRHCGGIYYDEESDRVIGACHEVSHDELMDDWHDVLEEEWDEEGEE